MGRLFFSFKYVALGSLALLLLLLPIEAHALSFWTHAAIIGGATVTGCLYGIGGLLWGCAIGGGVGLIVGIATSFLGNAVASGAIEVVAAIINFFGSWVASFLLNWATQLLSFGIALNTQKISDFAPVVNATQISTQIANLALVGIFIIIALATILDLGGYGIRKTLPVFIGIVLIVNFSTVFVGLLIDAGNTVMNFFWENSNLKTVKLNEFIIQQMNISQAIAGANSKQIESLFGQAGSASATAGVAGIRLLVLLLTLLASYIFLRLSLLLIMRVAALWILIMTAPLIFVIGILPSMRGQLKKWWQELLNWAFIGPATLFFFFFGLAIWQEMNEVFALEGKQKFGQDVETLSLFLVFPIVALFFMYALSTSKKLAGAAANGLVDGVINVGKGLALGTLALGAGVALGGVGKGLAQVVGTERMKNIGEGLQRAGFSKAGLWIKRQHEDQVKQRQEEVKSSSDAYDDLAKTDPAKITADFGKTHGTARKLGMIRAMMANNQTLSNEMQEFALKHGETRDPDLRKSVKEQYAHKDDKVYNATTGQITDYKGMAEKFARAKNPARVNLDSIATAAVPARGGLSPQQEAFMLLATQLDRGDLNEIAHNGPAFRKYEGLIASVEALHNANPNVFAQLATDSAYSEAFLKQTLGKLTTWRANAAQFQTQSQRGGGTP